MITENKKAAGSHQNGFSSAQWYYSNNNKIVKRFPPYGRKLFNALQCGYKPTNDIFLFIGKNAWQEAKYFSRFQDVLVFPQDYHPGEFDWSVVNGFSVLVFDTGNVHREVIKKLAYSLLLALAAIVRVALMDYQLIIFHKEEVNHGQQPTQR